MSTDGNAGGISVVDDANPQNVIKDEVIKNPPSQTPRFTLEEKQILYSLFHEHEDVIDIKFRKKSRNKYSVRDAWDQIVRDFNSHPSVNAVRSCKQIQKFWLNSRLRKQYPFGSKVQNVPNQNRNQQSRTQQPHQQQQDQQQQQIINHAIKTEPEFQIGNHDTNDQNDQSESFEEIEMDDHAGAEDLDDDSLEVQQQHQQVEAQQQSQLQQVLPASTIHVDQISADKLTLTDLLQFKTARPREEIILQIKHPGDTTGAQITLPSPTRITIPTHHTAQPHTMATITTNGYNQQIISEIKPQQITLAQYQAQQQLQQQQQLAQQQQQQMAHQAQLAAIQQQQQQQQQQAVAVAAAAAAVAQQQHQQQQQVKMQLQTTPVVNAAGQFATATPTFTCTTFSALPPAAAAAAVAGTATSNNVSVPNAVTIPAVSTITAAPTLVSSSSVTNNVSANLQQQQQQPQLQQLQISQQQQQQEQSNPFDEKMNYYKLKEAELKVKEQQVTLEKKKIELAHAEDQLKHLREVHKLQIEELKMKIRIMQEEEKRLRKTITPLPS